LELLVATRSVHKMVEIRRILGGVEGLRLLDLNATGIDPDPAEDDLEPFETFEENALSKARYFQSRSGLPTVADDSGLAVDALEGAPGVRSKRFAPDTGLEGEPRDWANNDHLLEQLGDRPLPERTAKYVCVAALVGAGDEVRFRGEAPGLILGMPKGRGGFGYDPLFFDQGLGKTFAQISANEKNDRSHRGKAFRALAEYLSRGAWRSRSLALALLTLSALAGQAVGQAAGQAAAQDASLQGRVRDNQGAAIDRALVLVRAAPEADPFRTTQTDELGFYRLERLPAGEVNVVVQRLGFAVFQETVTVSNGATVTLDIDLEVQAIEVEGLTVSSIAREREEVAFDEQAGRTVRTIDAQQLRSLPGFIEADPLRAAESLPGVITTSDFSAAFNVRGGSADQNLILIDGFPIFNPAHLGGLVSVFNPDMIERADLHSGGFPAEYGGRVSSVLAIETNPGNGDGIDVDGAISMLTSRVSVAGGLSEGTKNSLGLRDARWRVSGRRSYFDVLFKPFFDVPYRLADAQATFEAWTKGGDRISITGYSGGDLLDLSSIDSDGFPLKVDWDWGNDLIGLRWTKLRDGGGSIDARAGYSRFSTAMLFPDFQDTNFTSRISQATVAVDWEERPMRGAIMKVGAEVRQLDYFNSVVSGGTEFAGGAGSGWGLGTYGQLQLRPNDDWLLEAGVRLDGWYPTDWENSVEVAPRLSVKRFFGGGTWAIKGSVGRFTQFLHSIRDEELPLGLDIWVLTGAEAPPVVSDQAQLGVEFSPGNGLFFSGEAYIRDFDGVVTNNFSENPNVDFDEYLPGTGRSYGLDMFARKSRGRITGWLSVSWLRTTRSFPDFNSGVTPIPQIEYPPIFDRRLDVDLVMSRLIGARTEVGLRWNFGTGLPFTEPQGSFPFLTPRFSEGRLEWDLQGGDAADDAGPGSRRFGVLLGPRNGARYPMRHRLDVSIRRRYARTWGTFTPYVNVMNLYNRKNVLFYFFEFDEETPVRSGVSMFPLLPTFGVDIKFR